MTSWELARLALFLKIRNLENGLKIQKILHKIFLRNLSCKFESKKKVFYLSCATISVLKYSYQVPTIRIMWDLTDVDPVKINSFFTRKLVS